MPASSASSPLGLQGEKGFGHDDPIHAEGMLGWAEIQGGSAPGPQAINWGNQSGLLRGGAGGP